MITTPKSRGKNSGYDHRLFNGPKKKRKGPFPANARSTRLSKDTMGTGKNHSGQGERRKKRIPPLKTRREPDETAYLQDGGETRKKAGTNGRRRTSGGKTSNG